MTPLRVVVIGAGSWGTALAAQATNGHVTTLWGRDTAQMAEMRARQKIHAICQVSRCPTRCRSVPICLRSFARPTTFLSSYPVTRFAVLKDLAPFRRADVGVAWATKGFELGSGRFLHEVATEVLGRDCAQAIVTGPSFAKEVAQGLPTAVTVHSPDGAFALLVAEILHGPTFRAYTGNDMLGAELGGAMKNVLAVATGIADGMQLGLNARAGLITRGLNEMMRLNDALGGRVETLMGLAGLGDLVLTCTGDLSRNRRLGLALGRGQSIQEAVSAIGQVVESIQTADEVMRLAGRHGLDLPISDLVQQVLHGDLTPHEGRKLLSREQKPEYPPGWFA